MRILALIVLCATTLTVNAQMTGAQAFEDGKAFGQSAITTIPGSINATKGAEVLKDYSATPPPQSSYWQGAQTPLSGVLSGGMNTVIDCDANIGSMTDPQQRQHCEAVNYMNRLPSVKPPPMMTKTDPLYTTGRAIVADPQAIAGAIAGTYSGCTTNTVTNPVETVDQTCEEYSTTENAKCQIGQIVRVDPDHLYKCLETIKVLSDQQCTVGRVVLVSPEYNYQCIQNQYQVTNATCDKIANVSISTSNQLNCTPGALFSSASNQSITCFNTATMRVYLGPANGAYCTATHTLYLPIYPTAASWSIPLTSCGSGDRVYSKSFSCAAGSLSCTYTWCTYGSKIPDGCASSTTIRPRLVTVPAATATWDNQCAALEARAL